MENQSEETHKPGETIGLRIEQVAGGVESPTDGEIMIHFICTCISDASQKLFFSQPHACATLSTCMCTSSGLTLGDLCTSDVN